MTAFCDKCQRIDYESCMRVVNQVKLCRTCQINHEDFDCVFGCKCGEWGIHIVKEMIKEDGNFIKCKECKGAICVIYPEKETKKHYCTCPFCSVEEASKHFDVISKECDVCNLEFYPERIEMVDKLARLSDQVDHPSHYKCGGMEVIDVIEAFKLGFPLGNAIKYILRSGKKNDGLQDLQKAVWYLNHEINKIIDSHSLKGKNNDKQ